MRPRKIRPASEKALILGCFERAGRIFSRLGANGAEQGEFCPAWGRNGTGVKEKPPLREVLWGAVKYSSPRHAEKCSILPILSEQGRYFFH